MKKLSKLELIPAGVLYDNVFYRVGEFHMKFTEFHKATPSRVIIRELGNYISTTLPRFK